MAYTDWYVTPESDASDTNGGGSEGAPEYTIASGGGNGCDSDGLGTTLTDNSGSDWSGVEADDTICFDTAGVKELTVVTAVAPGGDATKVTVSPAVTGGLNDKTANVNGALETVQRAADAITKDHQNTDGDPVCVNVQYGTYNEAVAFDTNSGTYSGMITFRGYYNTIRDGCDSHTKRPTVGMFNNITQDYIVWEDFEVDATGGGVMAIWHNGGTQGQFRHIKAAADAGQNVFYGDGGYTTLWRCEFTGGAVGISVGANRISIHECYVTGSATYGIHLGSSTYYHEVVDCIIDSPTDDCIYTRANYVTISGNVCYGSAGGSGLRINGGAPGFVLNNLLVGNNQYGLESSSPGYPWLYDHNYFYGNSQGNLDANVTAGNADGGNNVVGTADPFADAANHDFTLKPGSTARRTGTPAAMPVGGTGYRDIGPLQSSYSRVSLPAGAVLALGTTGANGWDVDGVLTIEADAGSDDGEFELFLAAEEGS